MGFGLPVHGECRQEVRAWWARLVKLRAVLWLPAIEPDRRSRKKDGRPRRRVANGRYQSTRGKDSTAMQLFLAIGGPSLVGEIRSGEVDDRSGAVDLLAPRARFINCRPRHIAHRAFFVCGAACEDYYLVTFRGQLLAERAAQKSRTASDHTFHAVNRPLDSSFWHAL